MLVPAVPVVLGVRAQLTTILWPDEFDQVELPVMPSVPNEVSKVIGPVLVVVVPVTRLPSRVNDPEPVA